MKHEINKCIIPECNLDTLLIEVLLKQGNTLNHTHGNSNVANKMKSRIFINSFAVGIIDEDKRKMKDLNEFALIEKLSSEKLKLYKHSERSHYFIQICPAIEKWILEQCSKGKINLVENYELPDTVEGLVKLKSTLQRNDSRFKKLFSEMLIQEVCIEIRELNRWINYLKDKNYNANIEEL